MLAGHPARKGNRALNGAQEVVSAEMTAQEFGGSRLLVPNALAPWSRAPLPSSKDVQLPAQEGTAGRP